MPARAYSDRRGLVVTGAGADALAALDDFQENLLRGNDAAVEVLRAADEHPGCPLLQAGAAALHLYSQATAEIDAQARPLLTRASAAGGNERERLFIEALTAWADNDFWLALERLERLTKSWPQDLVAAKVAEMLFFVTGQSRCAPLLAMMERLAPEHPANAPFLAMHSFALELNGDYDRADARALAALELEDNLAWAQHTLTHLYLNRGLLDDGLQGLGVRSRRWGETGRISACHNWWHLALLHLAAQDAARARVIFHDHIWGVMPDNVFELVDAIALLWRLELAGERCDDEWRMIAPHARPRAEEIVFPFLSAHLFYALARAGENETVQVVLARIQTLAAELPAGPCRHAWGEVGLPLLRGSAAMGAADNLSAFQSLAAIEGQWACAGGSDAQNDLFDQTYLVTAIRSGQSAIAKRLWEARTAQRTPWPLEETWRAAIEG